MSPLRLAIRSLNFHWRTNVAVVLGVMAATAVFTGALVVGDSVRGSLRHLVLDRLGRVDNVLVTPQFFRQELAAEVARASGFRDNRLATALPAIFLSGTLETTAGEQRRRAGGVSVLGVEPEFWQLGHGGPDKPPGRDEIVLNQPLADELQARVGDEVILRLPQAAEVPADSPLGRKTETVRSRRLTVSAVIPADGLGSFGIRPTQQRSLNAFTAVEPLQQMLGVDNRINAILVAGGEDTSTADAAVERDLAEALRPSLSDYGVSIRKTPRGYFNITSDRMLLEPAIEAAVMEAFGPDDVQPAFTYLANYILAGGGQGKIPYSTIAAVDFANQPPLGPLLNRQGQPIAPLEAGEIVLNAWAADDLAAQGAAVQPGDTIEITYFEPESTHGKVVEARHQFRLKDIAQLAGPADDRFFTPEVKGVTDEASIADWNPPFPYDPTRVRSTPPKNQDDRYWQQYRATPKAFVSLEQGRKLWGSRFGRTTSIRIPARDGFTEQSLAERLKQRLNPAKSGFEFLPVKRLSLQAAAGTTPFAVLFLAFSMFIIAAALMLVLLLFKLGVETRADELGIVLAVGLRRSLARRMLLVEGTCVAAAGALVGAAAGVGFAWLMLTGLKTWWLGAISTPFLDLYVTPASLAIGFLSGLLVSLATIIWALRQIRRVTVRRLLSGQVEEGPLTRLRRSKLASLIAGGLLVFAVGIGLFAAGSGEESQAGAFFLVGALVLAALLALAWNMLRDSAGSSLVGGRAALLRLAVRNGGRYPLRSTLTIGLMAAACFLIVSVSAFQLDAPAEQPMLDSGDGGFALIARCDQPIYQNLNVPEGRRDLGFSAKSNDTLAAAQADGTQIFPLRVQAGDDASCLNLYQPRQPRILGVPQKFIERGGFAWAGTAATNPGERSNPWRLLNRKRETTIPVVLDQNTAMYSLHLYGGVGETFQIDSPRGGKITLQVVGLLKNSIFQGDLLVSEDNFLRLFPDTSGYRQFLVEAPQRHAAHVAGALESELGDYGFDTQTTAARLAEFFAVQNTYLAAFRSLGGLGLLLGTFGLAAVQLRSVVERRGELALLRAAGFRRSRLAQLVLLENASLLIGGLAAGVVAALVVLLPHLLRGGAGIPWLSLAATLAIVLLAGLLAAVAAVRAVLRAPLLDALRGN